MDRSSEGRRGDHTHAPSSTDDPESPLVGPTARARARLGANVLGRYRLDDLLGVGGSAAVYSATELESGHRFGIKILHPELSARDDLVRRFLREGAIAKRVDHPGLVPIFEDGRMDDGSVLLVMELLEGHTLERWATFEERLPIVESLRIAEDMLDVLAAAHDAGIVHRDIKPANVFRTRSGEIRVLDFGIARFFEGQTDGLQTQHGAGMGTPSYMPPEQARGRWNLVDGRTDVWAVGAVLFSLLSGEKPRLAETAHEELLLAMTEPVRSVLDAAPRLPPTVVDIVDRALAFSMDDRFADARAMQAALADARETLEDKSPASAPTRPDLLVEPPPESRSMVFVADHLVPPSDKARAPSSEPLSSSALEPVPYAGVDDDTAERPPLPREMLARKPPPPPKPAAGSPPTRPPEKAVAPPPPAPAPPAPGARRNDPITVPKGDVQLSSLARSAIGYDGEQRYVLVAAEGTRLVGLRLHRGIALWHHHLPDGAVALAVLGKTVVVASGASMSTVDLLSGAVGLRAVLPRPIDTDERVPNAPAVLAFTNPQPMLIARGGGSTLMAVHASHGTIVAERTFPARVEMAAWHGVLLVLYGKDSGKTLEILDPMTLATVAGPGRAPMPEADTVVSVTVDGPLLLVSGEKRGIFGSGGYVTVIDGRTMQEPVALRDKAIEPTVRPVLAGGGIVAVLRVPEGHALFAWPSGATAGTPLAGRKIVALSAASPLVFTVLEDASGARELATIDQATLAPRFGYGAIVEAAPLFPPQGLGAPRLAEQFIERQEGRVLLLAPTAPTHADARCIDPRSGAIAWSRSLVDVGLVEGWGFSGGSLVVRGNRALRALEVRGGTVVARY